MVNISACMKKMTMLVVAVTFAGLPANTFARSLHTMRHNPPAVYLSLGNRQQHYRISLPLKPDMTVLELLIAAVKSNMDTPNPYNVQLEWDETLECYIISKALGVENSSSYAWQLKIRNWTNQIVYKGQCLPRNEVTLSAFNTVSISYRSSRRHTSVRKTHR